MTDVHSPETRSYNMSRIRNKDTKPELLVRQFLYSKGFRYRLYDKNLPGKPDIVFPGKKTAIFIHGCFWHGHKNCKYFVVPKTRTEWWLKKIQKNSNNDADNLKLLEDDGWRVVTVYECELKNEKITKTLNHLLHELH
ncbi:MAG: DNA mismatch endonuclease Vsr [Prolixibacteraceae bacterium]|nr:DNA mismatch endonuclease Vsr [Prolixibacteraceae bacterium]